MYHGVAIFLSNNKLIVLTVMVVSLYILFDIVYRLMIDSKDNDNYDNKYN